MGNNAVADIGRTEVYGEFRCTGCHRLLGLGTGALRTVCPRCRERVELTKPNVRR